MSSCLCFRYRFISQAVYKKAVVISICGSFLKLQYYILIVSFYEQHSLSTMLSPFSQFFVSLRDPKIGSSPLITKVLVREINDNETPLTCSLLILSFVFQLVPLHTSKSCCKLVLYTTSNNCFESNSKMSCFGLYRNKFGCSAFSKETLFGYRTICITDSLIDKT